MASGPAAAAVVSVAVSDRFVDAGGGRLFVRGWRPAPGTARSVFIVGGRRLWRVDVRFIGTETIGTSLGNRRAIHIDGAAFRARPNMGLESNKPTRTFSVWLSDDADRVPLKMVGHTELGDVTMDLTEYSRP